ncbi:unnamed protein product [Trifolium pratense]|uniref:Uncharacterized protein n=1 Tax=Trifolium pratense TaxID=57577 RepID=A0ACB0LVI0_TRIPR|nr:unnamed protein product [Trifolium pratense]
MFPTVEHFKQWFRFASFPFLLLSRLEIPLQFRFAFPNHRCVRSASEVAWVHNLGMLTSGSGEEIGICVEIRMTSELSGNMINICHVGALTSKPFAFKP